jgi:uncharacterized membrane protein
VLVIRYLGLAIVVLFFLLGGVTHFTATNMFVSIMPPYIPFHVEIVYLTGVMEICAALCLLLPKARYWTGNFLVAFTIAVTPANIHMWLNPELFPDIEPTLLAWRLVLQVVLLGVIWFSTRRVPQPGMTS